MIKGKILKGGSFRDDNERMVETLDIMGTEWGKEEIMMGTLALATH